MNEAMLGSLFGARVAHIFLEGARRSLCGRVWSALIWGWFPGNAPTESECARCLERWCAAAYPPELLELELGEAGA